MCAPLTTSRGTRGTQGGTPANIHHVSHDRRVFMAWRQVKVLTDLGWRPWAHMTARPSPCHARARHSFIPFHIFIRHLFHSFSFIFSATHSASRVVHLPFRLISAALFCLFARHCVFRLSPSHYYAHLFTCHSRPHHGLHDSEVRGGSKTRVRKKRNTVFRRLFWAALATILIWIGQLTLRELGGHIVSTPAGRQTARHTAVSGTLAGRAGPGSLLPDDYVDRCQPLLIREGITNTE